MKPPSGKFPVIKICVLLFLVIFLYAESFNLFFSSSIINLKPCPTNSTKPKSNDKKTQQMVPIHNAAWFNDGFVYEPEECDFRNGKWVFNSSIKPLYSGTSCPYISRPYSCVKNGRVDSDYQYWEWQPEDCNLPKFNPELALKKLQGKRLLFVGDSLQKSQWESFVCMVEWIIPEKQKSMKRGTHSVFKAKEYNATIEFYWAPMLVESNTEFFTIRDPKKQIVKVDSIMDRARNWTGVDILVFNTYIWWMSDIKVKALWGSFGNGEEGYEELENQIAYNLGLRTWANWVDSTVDPNKTRVFFTTMSPTHTRSADWGKKDGVKCFNETKPIGKRKHWGSGSSKEMMRVVEKVVKRMKVGVTFINITQISEYRIDAHSSVYTESGGKLLSEEEKANPRNADCIHWCLPGVPDTWNQIFLAMF
ncbi:protein trichome birefringence-like 3 [Vigna radiata var. radiata]|uniref:Protein trichome birefringence-like 3 n=1 Tax=Vigna radiata var. radiata TaxID=3916 RepID=A0A1S3VD57_VIGRR|nr:protein trichome birefringence-like 3 [Vigna radiata var. radiata]